MDNRIFQTVSNNTWNNNISALPTLNIQNNELIVNNGINIVKLNAVDITILQTIMEFSYCPDWLIRRWTKGLYSWDQVTSIIASWFKAGIVNFDQAPTGLYLRPTTVTAYIFGEKDRTIEPIPYNTLNHSCSEMDVYFQIAMGNTDWAPYKDREIKLLNVKVPGSPVISERSFRSRKPKEEELINLEEDIKTNPKRITGELEDFNLFPIIMLTENGTANYHYPDLICPAIRTDTGAPRSVAVEVELTFKSIARYNHTLEKYKSSSKFNKVVWYVGDSKIYDALRVINEQINLNLVIIPYEVPHPDFAQDYKNATVNIQDYKLV